MPEKNALFTSTVDGSRILTPVLSSLMSQETGDNYAAKVLSIKAEPHCLNEVDSHRSRTISCIPYSLKVMRSGAFVNQALSFIHRLVLTIPGG
jgi:hypothetical protein